MPAAKHQRPLSPHLQIYKPQISSVLSIFHRITGAALAAGTLVLVAWLWAAAYDGEYFADWQSFFGHWLGQVLLIGWTFALSYHFANGIRHLFWDMGKGFELQNMARSGIAVVLFAAAATAGIWVALFNHISGA